MSSFFLYWFDLFSKRRLLFFLLISVLIVIIIWIAFKIKLTEDISKVLPRNEKVDRFLEVVNQSAFADELVLYIGPAQISDSISPSQLISFAIGALLGAVFLDILPEAMEAGESPAAISGTVLAGILLFFTLEKLLLWRHCHHDHWRRARSPLAWA